jgi:uncharacterized protein YndB with AHSA1/START domain
MQPRTPSPKSVVFRERALIAAEPERIWRLLVDLPRYADWNPWLVRAEGEVAPGGVVWADVVLRGRRVRAKHVVLTVEPGARLAWRDAGWNSLFVYGQRTRTLSAGEGGVVFEQELLIDGALAGLVRRRYGETLQAGLALETAALKRRAEVRA